MGSGAYSVFIDQQAGGGPTGAMRRVVPLPPPENSGAVKFSTVVLSLAYDNFGDPSQPAAIPAIVRVLRGSGGGYDPRKHRSRAQVLSLFACG
jgi:hypothetical protein